MSEDDRLISYAERILDDGCTTCNGSKVLCHCLIYLEYGPCCGRCSH